MAKTDYFSSPKPRVFAHRGFSFNEASLDENTIEAFRAALALGAGFIETDAQATADQVAVLFHDTDLKRLCQIDAKVSELTFAEIQEVSLENGGKIPSLREVLVELDGAKLNIDIKAKNAILPTVQAIEETSAHHRVLVSSFSNRRRTAALSALSKPVATSGSMATVLQIWSSYRFFGGLGLKALTKDIDALQLPLRYGSITFRDQGFIQAMAKHDVEVHFWTVNDQPQMRELLAIGASGIVTDRTDLSSIL